MTAFDNDQIPLRYWWFGWEHYEHPVPDLFAALARNSRTVLDIGASGGFYSLIALTSSDALVHAFEPYPPAQDVFRQNVALNPFSNRTHLHRCAVGDVNGTKTLYVPMANHTLLEKSCSLDPTFRVAHKSNITVDVVTLDQQFPDALDIDLIKIDVEGCEAQVIAGARKMIARCLPVIVLEILNEESAKALHHAFAGLNYELAAIHNDRVATRVDFSWDSTARGYLALPSERQGIGAEGAARAGVHWCSDTPIFPSFPTDIPQQRKNHVPAPP